MQVNASPMIPFINDHELEWILEAAKEAGAVRASTILVLGLGLQCGLLLIWMALFDRPAIRASLGQWRLSLWAGFLGALASQFWFIGFALTSAANVRTLALIEVIFASAVSFFWLRQPLHPRQLLGIAVVLGGVALLLQTT